MESLVYNLAEVLAEAFVRLLAPRKHMPYYFTVEGKNVRVRVDILEDDEASVFEVATAVPEYA